MKIAFISDIHANIFALKKVLKDIEKQNVDKTICLGDLVGYAPYPNEVIDLIRKEDIFTIQGNYDESTGEELMACGCDYDTKEETENANRSLFWTQDEVNEDNKEWLKNLPGEKRMNIEGWDLYLVHGSPRKNNEYLYAESKEVKEIADEYDFDILLSGHTHLPYFKVINGKYIVNVGSAGKPKHGNPRATYIILNITEDSIDFLSREVKYNEEKIAKAIEENEILPNDFAKLFRYGGAKQ
ncbi:MAG: metallophosphoesterase family protein [Bacillota bacterium]